MEILNRLQHWYQLHCDNDWEHSYGITIETLDNPGWKLSVDLNDTFLEDVEFQSIQKGNSESRNESWIHCYKENSCFVGMGGINDIEEVISIFLKWSDDCTDTSSWDSQVDSLIDSCNQSDEIEVLRQLYKEIDSIPNEHIRKKELVEAFNRKWNCLISDKFND